jgi:hypothetical protein
MKTLSKFFAVLLISLICVPRFANAVSWSPIEEEQAGKTAKGVLEKGSVVCLFQSGTADVKKEIRINDILAVYRENQNHQLKEVGKIRIRSYVGEDYLKGEVIEGEVKAGDIAKKGDVAGLVISLNDKCREQHK